MDATLQTYDIVIRASENFAKLDIVADSLAVFETNSPFDLTDEQSFLFRGIDRACRLNVKKPGFQFRKMKVMRPAGVTGDIVIKFAVGDGVEFIDGRLQYTSQTVNAPLFNVEQPILESRFIGGFDSYKDTSGNLKYFYDEWKKPVVKTGVSALQNLVADRLERVTERRIRLLTAGATLNLGTDYVKTDAGTGFIATLSDANPEVTIPGCASIYGTASADASIAVLETFAAKFDRTPVERPMITTIAPVSEMGGRLPAQTWWKRVRIIIRATGGQTKLNFPNTNPTAILSRFGQVLSGVKTDPNASITKSGGDVFTYDVFFTGAPTASVLTFSYDSENLSGNTTFRFMDVNGVQLCPDAFVLPGKYLPFNSVISYDNQGNMLPA